MKFIRAKIYGFAKWHDFQINFHPSELQVIYGENESGKSSIQQFILFMLFGLPPKKREFYRSKTSGKLGGLLTVFEEDIGEYTIERIDEVKNGAATCLLPNGEKTDENWLSLRLHGITRKTYQSIYSFDALDLASLQTMKEEDLSEILLGIGLTGSTDIYAAQKRLDTKIGELFKPSGKKPIINQQLEYVDGLYSKLQEIKSKEKTYQEKKDKVVRIKQDIERLQHTIQEEKQYVAETEKIRQARPNLIKLRKLESQLNAYPKEIPFPENGMKRWETIKENILPFESELAVLRNNANLYNKKYTELENTLMVPETYEETKQLLTEQASYNEHVKEIKNLEDTIKEQEISLTNEINNSDMKLNPADLNHISLTYQTENTWIQIYEESKQLRIDKESQSQDKAIQRKQKEDLEKNIISLEEKSLKSIQVDELTNRIEEYNRFQHQEKENNQRDSFKEVKKQKQKTSMNVLIGSIMIGIVVGLYGVFQGYEWCYGLTLALIVFGIAQWILGKQSLKTMETLIYPNPLQASNLMVTLEEKEEAEELLARHDEQLRQKAVIEEKLQTNKEEQIKGEERYRLTINRASRLEERIRQQRDIYPILETIDVSNWPAFYHTLKSLLQHNRELRSKIQQLDQIKKAEGDLRENIITFFTDKNLDLKDKTIDLCFTILQEKVVEHDNILRVMAQYKEWIKAANEQVIELEKKLHVFQGEQANLMEAAEAELEEQFYQRKRMIQEKEKIETNKEEIMDQLGLLFSDEKIRELSLNNNLEIEERQKEYLVKLELAEQELEERRKELAAMNADLNNMEGSDEHSETIHRYELEKAELKQLVHKWTVLKSAKEMLIETKNRYREKYMARILEQTSDFFAILTDHAYTNVFAPTEDRAFQVEADDQLRFNVNELSQGTKDQLYIALRIAISEVMSNTQHMPFIIDDAFVHFDEIRVENMMHLVESIAKKRQVLLFTCKKELINGSYASNATVLLESTRKI